MDLDHGTTLEEYIARVHAQRADLRESAAALDEALERPLGTARWRERVHTALVELAHDFRDHVDLSESGGGLFQTVLGEDPRLAPGIERQREEHVDLHERIETTIATLERDAPFDAVALREDLTSMVGAIVRHRQRGNDLIYEAFTVDLGGQG